jgi:hypothetical protein
MRQPRRRCGSRSRFAVLRPNAIESKRTRNAARVARSPAMEKKVFWLSLALFGLIADLTLPLIWAALATLPIVVLSWWIAYRSGWF